MTVESSDKIHITLGFDQNFWAPAFATMRSICLATHRRADLVFHLCHTELSEEALADLEKIPQEFGATLVHYDIERSEAYRYFAQTLPHTKQISAVTYARMLLDHLIPVEVDRLIYVDSDMLIRAPIEEIYDISLQGRPLGAVRDPHSWRFSNGRDVSSNRDLLDPADPFFNAGLLVIDLAAWRKMDMIKTMSELEAQGVLTRLTSDQDMLNYIFKGNWTELDPSWNTLVAGGKALEALHPKLVHYTGGTKPWALINGQPFSRVYRHVMTNELFYRYFRYRWRRKLMGWFSGLAGRKPAQG